VRISPSPKTRLQAIAIDRAGRIQYRYSPGFTAKQADKKYGKLEEFGESLPAVRKITREHLADKGLTKPRMTALVVRIIDETYFRVGAERNARRYKTFGITTLRNRHISRIEGDRLVIKFRGKRRIQHQREIVDSQLAKLIVECKQIPGSRLFAYLDDKGKARPIRPSDVNNYIKRYMGPQFSCKDFRTWGGTLCAARVLSEMGPAESERDVKHNILVATRAVAELLGNTPAVCRGSYIHPIVFDCYRLGKTIGDYARKSKTYGRRHPDDYSPAEVALLRLMRDAPRSKNRRK
jgi:DNA topoisomerase-1